MTKCPHCEVDLTPADFHVTCNDCRRDGPLPPIADETLVWLELYDGRQVARVRTLTLYVRPTGHWLLNECHGDQDEDVADGFATGELDGAKAAVSAAAITLLRAQMAAFGF